MGHLKQGLLMMLCLAINDGSAYGEWTLVSESTGMRAYLDVGAADRQGNLVTMWQLTDYPTAQQGGGQAFFSSKMQKEYDCAEQRFRILALTYFSDHMGGGTAVATVIPSDKPWLPVQSESLGKQLWEVACTMEGPHDQR
jgi:hypothetical protein